MVRIRDYIWVLSRELIIYWEAMAEILVSSLLDTVVESLKNQLLQELGIASGLERELQRLRSTFTAIQAVIQDAESKQRNNKQIEDWLGKLKDAAYHTDDVFDEFTVEALRRRLDVQRGCRGQVSTFFSLRNPFIFRYKMGYKIRDVKDRLDAIAKERTFHLTEGIANLEIDGMGRRQTSSLVTKSDVLGRDDEKEKIIDILLNHMGADDDVSVYAIWGMGGLGKTTLARLLFNDERVERHFQLRIWVCVSDDFDVLRLTRAIIESIDHGVPCNTANLDPLQRSLQEKLRGKRFLLVLDDVWNEIHEKWEGLREALRCGGKGSTVVVTTRKENIARLMAKALPVHHIGCLSEENSWSLFKRQAFGEEKTEENLQELEAIGKMIVKRCGGVPLAVKTLGGLMRFKKSTTEWLSVKDSEFWDLSDGESAILAVLKLSYHNLTLHAKQCFAYCSIFPKDYTMERDTLIQLWMANGYIPSRGHIDLHLIGLRIFNDLVSGSFLQDIKEDYKCDMTCKMHDLMHDLAVSVAKDECFIIEHNKARQLPDKVRHLSFARGSLQTVFRSEDIDKIQRLRSIVLLEDFIPIMIDTLRVNVSKHRYLRALDICFSKCEKLPQSISNMKHLRYLSILSRYIKSLPESIACLQNLQTLKLMGCLCLYKLPNGMKNMTNLRYLDIRECELLHSTPSGLGQLTCLQILSIFIVGKESGHRICELEKLNLGGELSIKELDNVRNSAEAESANLKRKLNLVSLKLCWRSIKTEKTVLNNVEEVLNGLQPHSNLQKLNIRSYPGSKFPIWFTDSVLQNLVEISLVDCYQCECLPPLGNLPRLKVLEILGMNFVKYFNNDSYGYGCNLFPALETLNFEDMPSLEEWTMASGGQSFSHLKAVVISQCTKLMELPLLPSLRELSIAESSASLIGSVMNCTSLTELSFDYSDLEVPPVGILQNLKDLEFLVIGRSTNLRTLSNELDSLSCLRQLHIEDCCSLESLPGGLRNLKSLEILGIRGCDSLTSLPNDALQGLSSLRRLTIGNCKRLECLSEGMGYLTALQVLSIEGCPVMKSFPDVMQHLTALRNLTVDSCDGLFSLPSWLGSLHSLSRLEILNCHNLKSLPNGLQGCCTLNTLVIKGCPKLEKRCKRGSGEDWPTIVNIPVIFINSQPVQLQT